MPGVGEDPTRSAREPTDAELELVAKHGTGPLERALALVKLAKRTGHEEELRQLVGEPSDEESDDTEGEGPHERREEIEKTYGV